MAAENEKPTLHLTGPSKGPPTVDDIMRLFTAITGKPETPEGRAEVQGLIDAHLATLAKDAAT